MLFHTAVLQLCVCVAFSFSPFNFFIISLVDEGLKFPWSRFAGRAPAMELLSLFLMGCAAQERRRCCFARVFNHTPQLFSVHCHRRCSGLIKEELRGKNKEQKKTPNTKLALLLRCA